MILEQNGFLSGWGKAFVMIIAFSLMAMDSGYAQVDYPKWSITIETALEAHDKRLYDFPRRADFLALHPEEFGTYLIGISLQRKMVSWDRLSLSAGIGNQVQLATFTRPFLPCATTPGKPISFILASTNRYYEVMLTPDLTLDFIINKNFAIWSRFRPRFRYYLQLQNTDRIGAVETEYWTFETKSIEYLAGLRGRFGAYAVELGVRLHNRNRIDVFTVNSLTHGNNAPAPRGYEDFNPRKYTLGLSRWF